MGCCGQVKGVMEVFFLSIFLPCYFNLPVGNCMHRNRISIAGQLILALDSAASFRTGTVIVCGNYATARELRSGIVRDLERCGIQGQILDNKQTNFWKVMFIT